jgi:hypothetical protein
MNEHKVLITFVNSEGKTESVMFIVKTKKLDEQFIKCIKCLRLTRGNSDKIVKVEEV